MRRRPRGAGRKNVDQVPRTNSITGSDRVERFGDELWRLVATRRSSAGHQPGGYRCELVWH